MAGNVVKLANPVAKKIYNFLYSICIKNEHNTLIYGQWHWAYLKSLVLYRLLMLKETYFFFSFANDHNFFTRCKTKG